MFPYYALLGRNSSIGTELHNRLGARSSFKLLALCFFFNNSVLFPVGIFVAITRCLPVCGSVGFRLVVEYQEDVLERNRSVGDGGF